MLRPLCTSVVYPRVYGGTVKTGPTGDAFYGLSPRVRGNQMHQVLPPAQLKVYPRVCGGTKRKRSEMPSILGLSPRVRGT